MNKHMSLIKASDNCNNHSPVYNETPWVRGLLDKYDQ